MIIIALFISILISINAYKRYIPVRGVSPLSHFTGEKDICLLDTRDYPTSNKDPFFGFINIPYAYLKRYYRDLPSKKVFIIATDQIEKNLAIRFLRKKGFEILGYKISHRKGEMNHGVQQTDYKTCKNY